MRKAVYRWLERNRWAGDAALATAFLIVLVIEQRATYGTSYRMALALLTAFPLYFRRNFTEAALVVSIGVMLVNLRYISEPTVAIGLVPIMVHASIAYAGNKFWGWLSLVVGLAGSVLAPLRWGYAGESPFLQVLIALCAVVVVAAYITGERLRERNDFVSEQLAALTERTRLLTIERDQRAKIAAVNERTRIARELHDIVAHSLSVIVVQADGGAAAVEKKPELAAQVLHTIGETSREALSEMRRLVGVLRSEGDSRTTQFAPQPGVGDLSSLVEQVRQAGVTVTFLTTATGRLPQGIDLTVYRIVQEALTNVLKHAGPQATAEVSLTESAEVFTVTVTDDGRGAAVVSDGAGNGLLGMRERVTLQGGRLTAEPRQGGGFMVRAEFPVGVPADPRRRGN